MVKFQKVIHEREVKILAYLAHEIWNQHFVPIIGQSQVDYMLENFQSARAIEEQLTRGFQYFLVNYKGEKGGYTGLVPERENRRMMISKLYIKKEFRGKGLGSATLDFITKQGREEGINTLWLTVNRHNSDSIYWYNKKGFVTAGEVKKDIGQGFFMDDFIMELKIG